MRLLDNETTRQWVLGFGEGRMFKEKGGGVKFFLWEGRKKEIGGALEFVVGGVLIVFIVAIETIEKGWDYGNRISLFVFKRIFIEKNLI